MSRKQNPSDAQEIVELYGDGRCGAKRPNGEACQSLAGEGTVHPGWGRCKMHSGSTPAGIKSALAKKVLAEAQFYGEAVPIEPAQALVAEIERTNGHVEWLSLKVASLDEEEEPEYLSWWLTVYHAERKHLASVSKMAVDAGIAERVVKLAEAEAAVMAEAILSVLESEELALTPAQIQAGRRIAATTLRALPAAS